MKQLEVNVVHSFRKCKSDIIRLQNEFLKLSETQERIMEMIDGINAREEKLYSQLKVLGVKVSEKPKTIIKTVRSKPRTIIKRVKSKPKTIVKTVTKRPRKIFVAAKEGKKFHIKTCPFAQQIKPKSKLIFKSKNAALNKGYKPCKCVK